MNILKSYIEKEKITQAELAKRLEVSVGLVSLYLGGKRKIGKKVAPKVSELTGVPILDILYPQKERRSK